MTEEKKVEKVEEPKQKLDTACVKEHVTIQHIRGDKVIAERHSDKFTSIGLVELAKLFGGAGTAMTYLALGIGTTPAEAGDTDLESEIVDVGLERQSVTPTYSGSTAILGYTWTKTGPSTVAVTEEGEFNAAAAGILAAHQVFGALNVSLDDEIKVTHRNVFAEG